LRICEAAGDEELAVLQHDDLLAEWHILSEVRASPSRSFGQQCNNEVANEHQLGPVVTCSSEQRHYEHVDVLSDWGDLAKVRLSPLSTVAEDPRLAKRRQCTLT